ncbi:MAG: NAD(P)H-binding protein [Bacteroidota bacterium]
MRAILIGGTGLVGSLLLQKLLNDPVFTHIKLISRRTAGIQSPRLEEVLIDFENEVQFHNEVIPADVLFCCIGTTQKKVRGDKNAYRKIDYDIPVKAAMFAAEKNTGTYVLVSSAGASAASENFYLGLKAATEAAVLEQQIGAIYIMRPSILLGKRNQSRILESVGKAIMQLLSPLLMGNVSKYKAIHANDVAAAMLAASKKTVTGKFICHYKEIEALAGKA